MHRFRIRQWRTLDLAAALLVAAVPVVLIAATWNALEPVPPRQRAPATAPAASTPERTREERRDARRANRARGEPAATPSP